MERAPAATPLFLDGSAGRLFAIFHAPAASAAGPSAFVYLAPFAEEMNRARRMAALQARALAASGVGVLVLDLFGTGDSDGDFRDARWQIWLEDLVRAADWLRTRVAGPIGLWGLRLGALLAAAAVAQTPDRFRRLLLWQPVLDGRVMLTQFLRIRVAAGLREDGGGETTEALRARFAAGETVEVAGYEVAPELAAALDGHRLEPLELARELKIGWFEVSPGAEPSLSLPSDRLIQHWRSRGLGVTATAVAGEQFWAIEEAAPVPSLLHATSSLVGTWQG